MKVRNTITTLIALVFFATTASANSIGAIDDDDTFDFDDVRIVFTVYISPHVPLDEDIEQFDGTTLLLNLGDGASSSTLANLVAQLQSGGSGFVVLQLGPAGHLPEPATLSTVGLGLAGLAWFARRKSRT